MNGTMKNAALYQKLRLVRSRITAMCQAKEYLKTREDEGFTENEEKRLEKAVDEILGALYDPATRAEENLKAVQF